MSQTSETADRCESPPSPTLCSNNCGFFSNAECNGMCSICYRTFLSNEKKTKCANESSESSESLVKTESMKALDTNSIPEQPRKVIANIGAPVKRPRRVCCSVCKKSVGLLAFECRCGGQFCETHRYPKAHQCSFDHKAAARSKLQEENPVVLTDKIDRV